MKRKKYLFCFLLAFSSMISLLGMTDNEKIRADLKGIVSIIARTGEIKKDQIKSLLNCKIIEEKEDKNSYSVSTEDYSVVFNFSFSNNESKKDIELIRVYFKKNITLNDLVNIFGKWDHYNGKAKEPCVGFFCDEKQVGNYCIDVTAWLGGRWNKVVLKREVSRLSIFVSKK